MLSPPFMQLYFELAGQAGARNRWERDVGVWVHGACFLLPHFVAFWRCDEMSAPTVLARVRQRGSVRHLSRR